MKLREAIARMLHTEQAEEVPGDNMPTNHRSMYLKRADKIIDRIGGHVFKYTLLGRQEIKDAFEQEVGE